MLYVIMCICVVLLMLMCCAVVDKMMRWLCVSCMDLMNVCGCVPVTVSSALLCAPDLSDPFVQTHIPTLSAVPSPFLPVLPVLPYSDDALFLCVLCVVCRVLSVPPKPWSRVLESVLLFIYCLPRTVPVSGPVPVCRVWCLSGLSHGHRS